MRTRPVVTLTLAVGLAGASVFMLKGWLNAQLNGAPTNAGQSTVPVVIARTQLPFGSRIHEENLTVAAWPAGSVPPGAFAKVDDLLSKGQDRVVLRSMEASEPVLASKVSGLGGRATLSTVVGVDHRAVTIRVNDVLGVAGFVLPGDRVDVLLTRKEANRDNPATDVLLQNVRVLGIDQDASDRKDKPTVARAVTLEVSTDQAQMLTLGTQVGVLSLALRNEADGEVEKVRTIGVADLRPRSPEGPRHAPRVSGGDDGGVRIGIFRGTEAATYTVRRE